MYAYMYIYMSRCILCCYGHYLEVMSWIMAQMCKCVAVCCIVLLFIKEESMLEAQLCKCAAV